jgi:hypothetical protein
MTGTQGVDLTFRTARLDREDFWRGAEASPDAAFKEWHHFAVLGPEVELLVNFSLSREREGTSAKIIVLGRAGEWFGFVQRVLPRLTADGCLARWGSNRLSISRDDYEISVQNGAGTIAAELHLSPRAEPMICRNQQIGPGRRLHWVVYPNLAVTGVLRLPGRAIRLEHSTAYHDHNWGCFRWGEDFTWEWATVLPSRPSETWAFVYSRLMNRARTTTTLEHLLAWQDGLNVLAAEGEQLFVEHEDMQREPSKLDLPPAMTLLKAREDADLPKTVRMTASGGAVNAALQFWNEGSARVIVPNETDLLGTTTIHETFGAATIHGSITGRESRWEGRGVFEFIRG